MKSESDDLSATLLFTLGVIVNSDDENRARIANAYADAATGRVDQDFQWEP